jgi:exopolysaccharide production protein ExoQ
MTQSLYPAIPVAAGAWSAPVGADRTKPWVERLSLGILIAILLYSVLGSAFTDASDTAQTDHVDPLNSWIWLGMLALSMPVLRRRWRGVMALLLSNWPLLLLFGYFTLSVSWALDPSASVRRVLFALVQFALFAILITGIRRAPLVHVVIVAVCGIAATADLISWIVAPGYAMTDEGFGGLQQQKNQAGLLMMYGCLAAVPCLFMLRSWLWRILIVAATVVMLVLLVATKSTTSESVVISAAFVMPLLLLIAKLPMRLIMAIVALFLLALVATALAYMAWCGATGTDPWLPMRGVTFTARTDIWSFVVDEIHKRPFLGAGYSSFWSIDPAIQPSLKSDQWFGVYAIINEGHNGYLDQLATGGIVGLAGALFVLFRAIVVAGQAVARAGSAEQAWRDGRLARPTAVLYLALLLGLILHNFTESNLFNNNALLAVAFLIATLDLEKWRLARRADTTRRAG